MRKNKNAELIEGYVYQHNLAIRKVENTNSPNFGKPFISGTLDVAVDEACTNVLQVHYTYVAEVYNSGKVNNTFVNLKRIIENGKTVVEDGIENALKVSLSPSLALNDFYPEGSEEVVSQMRNEGGFVNIVTDLRPEDKRATFDLDVILTGFKMVEPDAEKGIETEYAELRGVAFDFRNAILPITLVARNPKLIKGLESYEISGSNPVYTELMGNIVSSVVSKEVVIEGAFGMTSVDTVNRRVREWEVTMPRRKEPYLFDDESTITKAELTKALEDRNVYLAEQKKRTEDYRAAKAVNAAPAASNLNTIKDEEFNF